jgi:hypothetical protein
VIDLISLKPFDMETISKSIKKTRKALIVEECMKTGGIGASLSAVINESLFDELDHQVRQLEGVVCVGPSVAWGMLGVWGQVSLCSAYALHASSERWGAVDATVCGAQTRRWAWVVFVLCVWVRVGVYVSGRGSLRGLADGWWGCEKTDCLSSSWFF